jgi:hypothetical protein
VLATRFTNPCSSDNPHDLIPHDSLKKHPFGQHALNIATFVLMGRVALR